MHRQRLKKFKGLIIPFSKATALKHSIERVAPKFVAIISIQDMLTEAASTILDLKAKYKFTEHYAIHENVEDPTEAFNLFIECVEWMESKIDRDKIIVDITSGLVPTRFGVTMATIAKNMPVFYVSQQYLGIKNNLLEFESDLKQARLIMLSNPLEKIGILEANNAISLFNKRNYAAASFVFQHIWEKIDQPDLQSIYQGLQYLADGYKAWDVLQYSQAVQMLGRALKSFSNKLMKENYRVLISDLQTLIEKNILFLNNLNKEKYSFPLILDCYYNAKRRVNEEERFDDGVARYYRVIEMIFQYLLHQKSIGAGKIQWEKISRSVREEFCKLRNIREECLPDKLSLYDDLKLLECYCDPTAKVILDQHGDELLRLFGSRNQSILAHGLVPVREKLAHEFDEMVNQILLIVFPEEMKDHDFCESGKQGKINPALFKSVVYK